MSALTEYTYDWASFVFFHHNVVWQEITGQHKLEIEMSSALFTGKTLSAHDFNAIVLNSLEIVFVDQLIPHFPLSLSFK